MGKNKDEHEDDLVDIGSEESFPASDPPSYMGGASVAGPPPHDEPPREPVNRELSNPEEAKPAAAAPQGTDPARIGQGSAKPGSGANNP